MSILDLAKRDMSYIVGSKNNFSIDITLTTPDDVTTVAIVGLHTKHHLAIDTDGMSINSKNAHISFSESELTALSYPVRNASGEVDLKDHKVQAKDSTGLNKTYLIQEFFQDETLGLIVCILDDLE